MEHSFAWYIIKLPDGTCDIIQAQEIPQEPNYWGQYATFTEALAKRVGLIRSKKCKPK